MHRKNNTIIIKIFVFNRLTYSVYTFESWRQDLKLTSETLTNSVFASFWGEEVLPTKELLLK